MKAPELSFHGQVTGPFHIYLQTIKLIERIKAGQVHQTRMLCYSAEHLTQDFQAALQKALEAPLSDFDMEIYVPDAVYPVHTDKGGFSLMIPLEHECGAIIGGINHSLKSWGIYSFNDEHPHSTIGGVLMMKPNRKAE